MKKILMVFLVLFLVGCEENYAPEIEYSKDVLRVYADYEIGVNFTDHMLAMATSNMDYKSYRDEYEGLINEEDFNEYKMIYDLIYTHKVSYVFPQIFYYIPGAFNFDTDEKWNEYFNNWIMAIENRDTKYIDCYISDTDVEGYINDVFENTDEDMWDYIFVESIFVIEDVKELFKEQFVIYKKKIWPTLSFELHKRCENINARLKIENLVEKWEKLNKYRLNTEQLVFSLSKTRNPDFSYVGLKDGKIVMYYDISHETTELVEIISYRLGYEIVKDNSSELIKKFYDEYEYMNNEIDLYDVFEEVISKTVMVYDRKIFGYDIFDLENLFEDDNIYMNRRILDNVTSSGMFTENAIKNSLTDILKDIAWSNAFFINGKLTYHNQTFDELDISEELGDVTVYYSPHEPIFIKKDGELSKIVEYGISYPDVSSDGRKLLFVYPSQWESIGDVFIYDLQTFNMKKIYEASQTSNFKMKKAVWYDHNTVYLIQGYAYGTISRGGILYKYNIRKQELERVDIPLEERQEISDVKIEDDKFILTIVTHDEEYNTYSEHTMIVEIEN